ncbi:hypothetical protein RDI61_01600 [Pseudomonas plecoglossicida]|uniref:DUF7448 domain-containing protein n=1 Tax=Pseudomonas TaxID=286 RepID=UPI00240FE021|nr:MULTISPECIES: hypothetical protein [Pseudomonas]MDN5519005.1 hypothetical protein [Pseudomonas sp.]MDN5530922.1 hypothetical protein [Pseudomonas sp.]MDQ7962746.1 hypothetical protein [Pseudomonas plecoglossicida]WFG05256.1 hypothetical protein P3X84_11710 [Pseudomonas putida]
MPKETPLAFDQLLGITLSEILEAEKGSGRIILLTACGRTFSMHHYDLCSEEVSLDDVEGDISDIVGSPITLAAKTTSPDTPEDAQDRLTQLSQTWTFYRIGTAKGLVVLRWFGESNGYYSEEVDFVEITEG